MTLEGEPILEYTLRWPQLDGKGLRCRWINAYYRHMARGWRRRWRQEVYCQACLEWAECRRQAHLFRTWQGTLQGEQTLTEGNYLSFSFQGQEQRGDGRVCRVAWGDVWSWREGAPCTFRVLTGRTKDSRSGILQQVIEQGRARQREGSFIFRKDWENQVNVNLPTKDVWLTPEGVVLPFPQCSIAPAAEGVPLFTIPIGEKTEEERPQKTRSMLPIKIFKKMKKRG